MVKPEVDRNHSISKSRNEYKKGSLRIREEYFNKAEESDAGMGRDNNFRLLQNTNNNTKRVQGHFRNESFGTGRPVGENPKQDYGQPLNLGQSVELPAVSVGPGLTKTVIERSQSLEEPEKKFFWGEISQSMHLNTLEIQSKTAPAVTRELDKCITFPSSNIGDRWEPLDETPIQRSSLNYSQIGTNKKSAVEDIPRQQIRYRTDTSGHTIVEYTETQVPVIESLSITNNGSQRNSFLKTFNNNPGQKITPSDGGTGFSTVESIHNNYSGGNGARRDRSNLYVEKKAGEWTQNVSERQSENPRTNSRDYLSTNTGESNINSFTENFRNIY